MPVFSKLKTLLLKHFMEMRWQSVVLAIACYFTLSWVLLWLSGEEELTAAREFFYWVVVTASTVGYGDLSPITIPGKLVVALFVIPFGLGLFGLAVGRLAAFVSFQWRKGVKGLKPLDCHNHLLVIGWNEGRTMQLIRLLQRELAYHHENKKLVLCVRSDIENPLPNEIEFVKVRSYNDGEDMGRASVQAASCIIIDSASDEATMTTALYCSSQNSTAHIIAYFQDESLGGLLKQHCPNIECMPSVAVEMMAKSAMDPGSSILHHELLDVDHGMTQYSMAYRGRSGITVRDLFSLLKERYDATLIGVSNGGYSSIQVNPPLTMTLNSGSTLYYIADERINSVDWESLNV